MTADDHEVLLARSKPAYDGAKPCGNSVALLNLLRLDEITSDPKYRTRAESGFAAFASTLERRPTALPKMLVALDYYLDRPVEVIIVSPQGQDRKALERAVADTFLPNHVLLFVEEGADLEANAAKVPLLEGKKAMGGLSTAFVCEKGLCEAPTSDPGHAGPTVAARASSGRGRLAGSLAGPYRDRSPQSLVP